MAMSRLLKEFNYFWNRKPSQWTKLDTIWLHRWLLLLKNEAAGKKENEVMQDEDMEVLAKKLFN